MSDENINPATLLPSTPIRSKFAVFVPTNEKLTGVYNSKAEALSVVQGQKGARFAPVFGEEDAQDFFSAEKQSNNTPHPPPAGVVEESCPFSTPSLYSNVVSALNNRDIPGLKSLIDTNPLYLVTKVDAPTILHQGCRYNALHMCANKNFVDVAKFIIDVLRSGELFSRLYPNDPPESRQSRISRIIDMYINSPDRLLSETPLHFASKMGNVEMVWLLASQNECILEPRNKNKQTPGDIICDRAGNATEEQRQRIRCALSGQYFVLLLRPLCNPLEPLVRPPIRASSDTVVASQLLDKDDCKLYRLTGYVGPVSQEEAKEMYETLTKPSRRRRRLNDSFNRMNESSLLATPNRSTMNDALSSPFIGTPRRPDPCVADPKHGLENCARQVCSSVAVPFYECFEFLNGEGIDVASHGGFSRLELYLKNKHVNICRGCDICYQLSANVTTVDAGGDMKPELGQNENEESRSDGNTSLRNVTPTQVLSPTWKSQIFSEPARWFGRFFNGFTGYLFKRPESKSPGANDVNLPETPAQPKDAAPVSSTPVIHRSSLLSAKVDQNKTLSDSFIEQFAAMKLTSNDSPRSVVQSPGAPISKRTFSASDSDESHFTASPRTITGKRPMVYFGNSFCKPSAEDLRLFKLISEENSSGGNVFFTPIDFPFLNAWYEQVLFVKENTLNDCLPD